MLYFLHPAIRWIAINNNVIILDSSKGSYLAVADQYAEMFKIIACTNPLQIQDQLLISRLTKFNIPNAELEQQFSSFIDELKEANIVLEQPPCKTDNSIWFPYRPFLFGLQSLPICILSTRIILACIPFKQVFRFTEKIADITRHNSKRELTREQVKELVDRFCRFEAFLYNSRAYNDCLGRSLALFYYLKIAGVDCSHIIGIRDSPLEFHAWVRNDSVDLLNDPDYIQHFTPISTIS